MSPRVLKGFTWFKKVAIYCGIFFGISLVFAFRSSNTVNSVAAALAGFVGSVVVFGAAAFVAGWIWGAGDSAPKREQRRGY